MKLGHEPKQFHLRAKVANYYPKSNIESMLDAKAFLIPTKMHLYAFKDLRQSWPALGLQGPVVVFVYLFICF